MDIFLIQTANIQNIEEDLLAKFQKKEIFDKKKYLIHCFTYLMLDRILKEVYKIENSEIDFINKKPILKNQQKYFSISHSGEYIALAFSDTNCGIDIEKFKNRDFEKIAHRLRFDIKTPEDFFQNWTLYEAEYKLSEKSKSSKTWQINNYMLSAVSPNSSEDYQIYFDTIS